MAKNTSFKQSLQESLMIGKDSAEGLPRFLRLLRYLLQPMASLSSGRCCSACFQKRSNGHFDKVWDPGFSLPLVDDLVNLARTSFHRELPKTCRENVFKMQMFHVPIPLLLCQSLRFTIFWFKIRRMKVTCRPKCLDRFRFSTHVFFSSPNLFI